MKLVDDWKQAARFNSVRAAAVLAALSLVQSDVLPYAQPLIPAQYWPWVSLGMAALIVVFRVLQQSLPKQGE